MTRVNGKRAPDGAYLASAAVGGGHKLQAVLLKLAVLLHPLHQVVRHAPGRGEAHLGARVRAPVARGVPPEPGEAVPKLARDAQPLRRRAQPAKVEAVRVPSRHEVRVPRAHVLREGHQQVRLVPVPADDHLPLAPLVRSLAVRVQREHVARRRLACERDLGAQAFGAPKPSAQDTRAFPPPWNTKSRVLSPPPCLRKDLASPRPPPLAYPCSLT